MVSARVDAGAGGSSFAWFVNAAVFYSLSDLVSLSTGFRSLPKNTGKAMRGYC